MCGCWCRYCYTIFFHFIRIFIIIFIFCNAKSVQISYFNPYSIIFINIQYTYPIIIIKFIIFNKIQHISNLYVYTCDICVSIYILQRERQRQRQRQRKKEKKKIKTKKIKLNVKLILAPSCFVKLL